MPKSWIASLLALLLCPPAVHAAVEVVILTIPHGDAYTVPTGKVLIVNYALSSDPGTSMYLEKDGAERIHFGVQSSGSMPPPPHLGLEIPAGWAVRVKGFDSLYLFARLVDVSDLADPFAHSLSNFAVNQGRLTASVTKASSTPARITVEQSEGVGNEWTPAQDAEVVPAPDHRSYEVSVPADSERVLIRTQAMPVE